MKRNINILIEHLALIVAISLTLVMTLTLDFQGQISK